MFLEANLILSKNFIVISNDVNTLIIFKCMF